MSSKEPSAGPSTGEDRELREQFARWSRSAPPPPVELGSLYAGLERQLARERGALARLRALPTPARAAIASAALLLAASGVALCWLRPDLSVYPEGRMASILLFSALLIATQLGLLLRPLQRPAASRWAAPGLTLGACLGLFALYALPAAHLAHPASLQAPGVTPLLSRALPCLLIGLVLASATHALLRALDRGGVRQVLLAGVCSGVSANLLLQLHCPVTAPAHLLLGHLGVALAFAGGVVLWSRAARSRPGR